MKQNKRLHGGLEPDHVGASVGSYVALVSHCLFLSLLVWCLGKVVLLDCGISWVSLLIFVLFEIYVSYTYKFQNMIYK